MKYVLSHKHNTWRVRRGWRLRRFATIEQALIALARLIGGEQ